MSKQPLRENKSSFLHIYFRIPKHHILILSCASFQPLTHPLRFDAVRTSLLVPCRKWTVEQIEHAKKGSVAVLYASAYGNTAGMAQAISRGITKAGIGVETLNLEVDSVDDALEAVKRAKGFIIGSPTLGGHLPTQVSSQGLIPSALCAGLLWISHVTCTQSAYCELVREQTIQRA